ncbi:MAG: zf-HC2 domain-containing protein [Lachnospiraceae bacterium]|nr:zf-HC2 domain-containing protein [Ruminococcus sp.]MCM1274033.1 zf-HC2 domain-containing protein [Lachnospiraceae bacterium]
MKCEIIRDLIPLYDEKLCSGESAALVEEHIKTCAACKELLEELPKADIPKADPNGIKPFAKVKRRLRGRIAVLIALGVVLLAVLIPVGYLTVNQIFHFNGGTDFEDIIYKSKAKQFAEMIAEGRAEEYTERCDDAYRDFYLEKLRSAYEKVEKYEPRVGEVHCSYHNHHGSHGVTRELYFNLEFTLADGSPYQIRIYPGNGNSNPLSIGDVQIPIHPTILYDVDPEKTNYENYSVIFSEENSPTDLREICAYLNLLYLVDGGNFDINVIEGFSRKKTIDPYSEESVDNMGHLVALRFAVSDYKAVYNGLAAAQRSNYIIDTAISDERFDEERNMFYYPVILMGFDGERYAVVSIKLYYDEFGFHSPRPEDIKGITGNSDLEMTMAKMFG